MRHKSLRTLLAAVHAGGGGEHDERHAAGDDPVPGAEQPRQQ
ncbi:hypothetical protein [Actinomadura sp. NPDC048394]